MFSSRVFMLAVVCVSCAASAPSRAADDPLAAALSKALEAGWGKRLADLQTARDLFQDARRLGPSDPRVPYGQAVVELRHHRYTEAAALVDGVLAGNKNHREARFAKAWLHMLRKEYPTALEQLDLLAQAASGGEAEAETARFVGRMIGFLEGPAAGAVAAPLFQDYDRKLLSRFTEVGRQALLAEREAIRQEAGALSGTVVDVAANERQQLEQKQEAERSRLDKEKQEVKATKDELQAEANRLKSQVDQDLSAIDRSLAPLEAEFNRLQARAAPIANRIALLDRDVVRLRFDAQNTEDPAARAVLLVESDRLVRQIQFLRSEYDALDAQARVVNADRLRLLQQRDGVIRAFNAAIGRLGDDFKGLQRAERRLTSDEKKNEKPVTGVTTRVRALAGKAGALTTYFEFPFDQERTRLVESFAAKP